MSVYEETLCGDYNCSTCYGDKGTGAHSAVIGVNQAQQILDDKYGNVPLVASDPQHLPTDAKARKGIPLATGVVDYFPDALVAVARLSQIGNDQHNPGQPLHWAREKSTDHRDTLLRHFTDAGTLDTDGVRHSAKVAWRALAILQLEIEAARNADLTAPTGKSDNIIYGNVQAAPGAVWRGPWFQGTGKSPNPAKNALFEFRWPGFGISRPILGVDLAWIPDCEYREVRL